MALCDVDPGFAARTFGEYPSARAYSDYRQMLDRERDLDAVIIATPDHTHAVIAMEAMRRGKHVYCEKPLTRTVAEARALAKTAREQNVVTQMGNQGHAGEGTRHIREWIEAGVIGTVREVQYWTNRPIWPQAIDRPTDAHHAPPGLDWDLFLGPARYRPYHPAYHPFKWRGWWDYGTGALGDIACHSMDAAFWALELDQPTRIEAQTTPLFAETAPAVCRITYEFPARGSRPPVRFVWRDGDLAMPRPPQLADGERAARGTQRSALRRRRRGDRRGHVWTGTAGISHEAPSRRHRQPATAQVPTVAGRLSRVDRGLQRQWHRRVQLSRSLGAAHREVVLLGNLAVRTGQAIEWDAKQMRATNVPEANAFLDEEYRAGWSL